MSRVSVSQAKIGLTLTSLKSFAFVNLHFVTGGIDSSVQVYPFAFDPDVRLIHPPTVVGRSEPRSQTALNFWGVALYPSPHRDVVDRKSALGKEFFHLAADREKRRYQPTASRMTSGSNCRHLKRPETEGVSRSIERAYQITPPKLQHFPLRCVRLWISSIPVTSNPKRGKSLSL